MGGCPAMTRCAVIGRPVEHSLSPVLHRAAYAALGLDWSYDAVDAGVDELASFLESVSAPTWRGLSVTMPLKRAIIQHLDDVEDLGRLLAAVNTVVVEPDGRRRGFNTDVPGMVAAFREHGTAGLSAIAVLGGGAPAGSVLAAAADLGASRAHVFVRDPARAVVLSDLGVRLDVAVHVRWLGDLPDAPRVDAVVSTIPTSAQAGLAVAWAPMTPLLFDVGYVPTPTPFMQAAAREHVSVIGGFALLLHQAAAQVQLMCECRVAPLEAMRAAGMAAL